MTLDAGALTAAVALAAVHLTAPAFRFVAGPPRSAWLSGFGGASVAYVFVYLLPELAEWQVHVERSLEKGNGGGAAGGFAERHVYLVALVGLATFYGLERLAAVASERGRETEPAVFWIHMGSFAGYNALVGYLLVQGRGGGGGSLLAFSVAMALHFVVTDLGLLEHHQDRYRHAGRWLLAAAVLAGFLAGTIGRMPGVATGVLLGFLAGGIMLNALKEELPAERQSRFWAFLVGLTVSTVLLLIL